MHINKITNTINFGYNKKLNDDVNTKLVEKNTDYSEYLLHMNLYVNNLEDRVRYAENNEKDQRTLNNYAYILTRLKPIVSEMIDEQFPKMKYTEKELKDYKKELKERKLEVTGHWLEEMVCDMSELVATKKYIEAEEKEEKAKTKANKAKTQGLDKPIIRQAATAIPVDESASKLVERFVPTEFSPDGLKGLGGMKELKESLVDKIIFPAQHPEEAYLDEIEYGKKTPRGILLYGPPGCGKTSVIEAVATESGFPLYKLKVGKTGSKYVNETSSNVQRAYEYVAAMAHNYQTPVFLAIDEMEAMTGKRGRGNNGEDDKLVSTLLQIIEEARGKNVIVLGATNCFDNIDEAVRSRFDDKIYVGLPDDETRREVLKIHLNKRTKGQTLAKVDQELDKVVKMTRGFSNRDIAILTDKAALIARKDGRRDIEARDFEIPVKENQNMKVKESLYQDKTKQPHIGFGG